MVSMPAAAEEPEELLELPELATPRTFRRLLRRPGRRQVLLALLLLIFGLSLGLSMQVYTRRTRPHRLNVWQWGGKGRSRAATQPDLDMAIVSVNSTVCEWESGAEYLDQVRSILLVLG
jgi:hypothetical protein